MRTLSVQVIKVQADTTAALTLAGQLSDVELQIHRQYIAELIVVRLFSLFEIIVEDAACRLICGAAYSDGTLPARLRANPTSGFQKAREEMKKFRRNVPRNELRWGAATEIAANLENLFLRTEHFTATLLNHGIFISELRKVRNHIAHGTAGTHRGFQEVVSNIYGAKVPGMTPGRMLLSPRFRPSLLERFCRQTNIVLRTALKG